MKKLLLILLCLPMIGFGQDFSLRSFPIYLVPSIIGSSWGIDYHLNENAAVDINLHSFLITGAHGSGNVINISSGYKKFSKKRYFIAYRIKLMRYSDFSQDEFFCNCYDIDNNYIYYTETEKRNLFYTLGPEINFGKRFYFTKKRKGFLDLGIGVSFNAFTLYSLKSHENINYFDEQKNDKKITREVIEYEKIDSNMRVLPNFILQFGYFFNKKFNS